MSKSEFKKQPKKNLSGKEYPAKPLTHLMPLSPVYPVIDTDLARDNVENDLSEADKQDL